MSVGSACLLACHGSDSTGIPAFKTTDPYVRLQLNVRGAVLSTIAPYDTVQLVPTAIDANDAAMPLPGPVTYTAGDTTLSVSATGLVTVKYALGARSFVVASVQDTSLNLTHADTAFILATATVPTAPLANFSIHPVGTDSAVLDIGGGTKKLTVTATDASGKVIPAASLLVHYTSRDVGRATINATTGAVTAVNPGTVRLTASTTYYGVTKTDSLQFRIGYPDTTTETTMARVLADGSYRYNWMFSNLVIGVGKTVIFKIPGLQFPQCCVTLIYAGTNLPIGDRTINEGLSVVFDDSSVAQASPLSSSMLMAQLASNGMGNVSLQVPDSVVVVDSIIPTGGNVPGQYSVKFTKFCSTVPYSCATARSFSTPGMYHFTSPNTGASATITVVAP